MWKIEKLEFQNAQNFILQSLHFLENHDKDWQKLHKNFTNFILVSYLLKIRHDFYYSFIKQYFLRHRVIKNDTILANP